MKLRIEFFLPTPGAYSREVIVVFKDIQNLDHNNKEKMKNILEQTVQTLKGCNMAHTLGKGDIRAKTIVELSIARFCDTTDMIAEDIHEIKCHENDYKDTIWIQL